MKNIVEQQLLIDLIQKTGIANTLDNLEYLHGWVEQLKKSKVLTDFLGIARIQGKTYTAAEISAIQAAMLIEDKLQSIKFLKEKTGMGLRDAKGIMDNFFPEGS